MMRQLLLVLAVVGVGFYAGATWREYRAVGQAAQPRAVEPRKELRPEEKATAELFHEASPSVVYITSLSLRRDFFSLNAMKIPQGTGSGFIWDEDGYVVTNYHVIRQADEAQVTLSDQSNWNARLVGAAPDKDLAVLRIETPRERLRALPLGSSGDLIVGQSVFAIGNPFGLDQTLTTGIISALDREIESVARIAIRGVIQTDAAINPGNSGGPLLDSSGRLIGVNTAIYSPSGAYAGIGFAIPADTVNWVVPELISHGRIRRPVLGIEGRELRQVDGVLVMNVTPGGGAEAAGIRPTRYSNRGRVILGDIIVAIEGEKINSMSDLVLTLEEYKAGEVVTVTVRRDREEMDLEVRLQESR